MLGLTALEQTFHPVTSLDKLLFLIEHTFASLHHITTLISFSALFALVFLRWFKNHFQKTWWIYRIPEVLVVVVVSTSEQVSSLFLFILRFPSSFWLF